MLESHLALPTTHRHHDPDREENTMFFINSMRVLSFVALVCSLIFGLTRPANADDDVPPTVTVNLWNGSYADITDTVVKQFGYDPTTWGICRTDDLSPSLGDARIDGNNQDGYRLSVSTMAANMQPGASVDASILVTPCDNTGGTTSSMYVDLTITAPLMTTVKGTLVKNKRNKAKNKCVLRITEPNSTLSAAAYAGSKNGYYNQLNLGQASTGKMVIPIKKAGSKSTLSVSYQNGIEYVAGPTFIVKNKTCTVKYLTTYMGSPGK